MKKGETLKHQLGRRIKELRKAKGMTQEKLAEKLAVSVPHVGRIEVGLSFPSSEMIEKLASVLGVPVMELFRFPEGKNYKQELVNQLNQFLRDKPETYRELAIKVMAQIIEG